ncbi:MAG: PRD domain-containing protein [Lachnospiraceae bacterium]|nr:PRD domain-containing protein [Lachnospiraceae bacterium]
MKKNRELVYEYIWKESLSTGKKKWQTEEVANALKLQRTNVSTILNELTVSGRLTKSKTRPVFYQICKTKDEVKEQRPFEGMIGYDGSLKRSVELAKKCVLYPSDIVNIQVLSDVGSGSTTFCKNLYEYGVKRGRFTEGRPFIYVNCRHFQKNFVALNEALFGDEGGFEKSAFVRAEHGMLFVDHVELLNPEQYSRIVKFLETGEVYSEVEKSSREISQIVFVFTTPEQEDTHFDWYHTAKIHLPALNQRGYAEKLEVIRYFLTLEAKKSGCNLRVDMDVIRLLMNVDYKYGLKGLVNAIKSTCASAYVRMMDENSQEIYLIDQDLPEDFLKFFRPDGREGAEIDQLLGTAESALFSCREENDSEMEATQVYGQIREQYQGMLDRGIEIEKARDVIASYLRNIQYSLPKDNRGNGNSIRGQLSQMVDFNVINYVSLFADRYRQEYGKELTDNMFCGLCLHLQSVLKQDKTNRKRIDENQVKAIISCYPREYATMLDFAYVLHERFYINFPIEETAILTMFIIDTEEKNSNPVILYALHGAGVATGLAAVAAGTTKEDNVFGLDLDVEAEVSEIADALEKKIQEIHRGGGVIVIYDMVSMESLLARISERLNIKIRWMNIPIHTVGVTASRNCERDTDIDRVFHGIRKSLQVSYTENKKPKAILTICHTSEGGAEQLKNYIKRYSHLGYSVFALSMSDKERLIQKVLELKKTYKIHAFVGTFDPEILGIPFISIADVFECKKSDLDHVLLFENVQRIYIGYDKVIENYSKETRHLNIEKVQKLVPDTIEKLAVAYDLESDERIGLCAHMVYMLDALSSPDYKAKSLPAEDFLELHATDYKIIRDFVKPLEKSFDVVVSDDQMALLIRILKKLD